MFYEPRNGHGLPHDPGKAIVSPRPIGWISTRSRAGIANLSPYSFFTMLGSRPFLVCFSSEGEKDSMTNARDTGEFAVNLASRDLFEQMHRSSVDAPPEVDEFAYAGLTPAPCRIIAAPRVAEAHAALECKVTEVRQLKDIDGQSTGSFVVTGQVVGVHIDDDYLVDGHFDTVRAGNVSRLGYLDYSFLETVFQRRRPRWDGE